MNQAAAALCPDEDLADLIEAINSGQTDILSRIGALIDTYDRDARLHFLRGSLLAGAGDYDAALAAMGRSVKIAPDYAVARFQFGFLTLTCGRAADAQAIWKPLLERPGDQYFRLFVEGLTHMIRDEFELADACLARGIEANTENLPLNADMQLVRDEMAKAAGPASSDDGPDGGTSSAQALLRQYAARSTKH